MRRLISEQDEKMLSLLLSSNGRVSSEALSRRFGISVSEGKARRKKLTEEYMRVSYKLNLERYGWRKIEILISTRGGRTLAIGEEIMKHRQIVHAARTIGQFNVDLKAEAFVRTSEELLDVIEKVKAVNGVKDAIWIQVVDVIGDKIPPPQLRTYEATTPSPKRAQVSLH
jgi:DNA-binding Lrp family transcriptional regulator